MVKYISIYALGLLFCQSCLAQATNTALVYPDMDHAIMSMWLSEDANTNDVQSLQKALSDEWRMIREDIATSSIEHFDKMSFIEDQDVRIASMHDLIAKSDYNHARKEAYVMLSQFKEARECFTQDDYTLDYVLDAYDGYLSVHGIIHDEMMGLYEWREFVWFVDNLKVRVQDLETHLTLSRVEPYHNRLVPALDKLKVCLTTLDESLGDAYRPDFVMPCNELGISFKELISAYNQQNEL